MVDYVKITKELLGNYGGMTKGLKRGLLRDYLGIIRGLIWNY